jgi:ribonucleoside-diphosphate reductase alpha chain
MTETANSASRAGGTNGRRVPGKGKGVSMPRIYTTPGVHPYDEVTWELRDVVQTNWKTGETIFEQRGVEFPDFWSVNAGAIVTTKYFRGAPGTPARERSLRQLIDRVVLTYVKAGKEYGYFGTDADAEIFEHELTYALLHQVFSFNSPVWFNVGTPSPQQVSACQPYDALVSTPAGLVPIGRLVEQDAVGTKVFDAHGVTSVVATKANGVKEVLRVYTKAGYAVDVTADHLVWRCSSESTGRFVPAGSLRPGDQLEWHRRDAYGEKEIDQREIAEAALAGWLQSDGFVGQYAEGTNRSLTIEAMTVTPAELAWVTAALDRVLPDVHRHERPVVTQDESLDCRRTRLYGEGLAEFVDAWGLRARGAQMQVPERLFTAPLPVVAAYLRSVFQAEGFVSARERSTVVEVDMVGEEHIRGMQALLLRFGIFARVGRKADPRPDRQGTWSLRIQTAGDRRLFADTIGFVDPMKTRKLEVSLEQPGLAARSTKRLEIARIESRGAMEVYDIQTESGEYLSGNLRVHNCFILSVDDSMDSILNWYKEEGFIFKGGSGAGLNLSASAPPRSCCPPAAPPRARSPSCAAPTPRPAPSSPVAPPAARPRWSSSTSTTPTSRSSSRPRRARRTRSAPCATPASTWTSAARTSSRSSTRTPTTRCASPTSSCGRSRTGKPSSACAAAQGRLGHRDRRRSRAHGQDRQGRVGVRRPGHPVRRHDQRLAHQPRDRPHHGIQPVLGVHVAGQLLVQPGLAQPAEVPARRRHLRRGDLPEGRRARHHGDGHLDLLRRLPDRADR